MNRITKTLAAASALALAMAGAAIAQGAPVQQERRITVQGHGSVQSQPDMAIIFMGVVKQAREAQQALAETSTAMRALLEALKAAGISERDVQTSGVSLSPVWKNNGSTANAGRSIVGFTARNTVRIRLRDLQGLGSVLDTLIKAGANTVQGLNFGLQDPRAARDAARQAAVADAMHTAQVLARAAGVELGPVLSISQGQAVVAGPMMTREMALASDVGVPIASGEVSTVADVSIVFALK